MITILRALKLYCDNSAAVAFSKNTMSTSRSKHIDIKYYFVSGFTNKRLTYMCIFRTCCPNGIVRSLACWAQWEFSVIYLLNMLVFWMDCLWLLFWIRIMTLMSLFIVVILYICLHIYKYCCLLKWQVQKEDECALSQFCCTSCMFNFDSRWLSSRPSHM